MTDPEPPGSDESLRSTQGLILLVCLGFLSLPTLLVDWPPSTDLPQLVAQVELAKSALAGEEELRLQGWHPNKLGYLPLVLGGLVEGPQGAGRWAFVLLAALWGMAAARLARRRGRPIESVALACLFFFNPSLHWGFLNFQLGTVLFMLLWAELEGQDTAAGEKPEPIWKLVLGGLLLYSAHVLWLAVATGLLAVAAIRRRRWTQLRRRMLCLAPAWLLVAAWFVGFRASGVDTRVFWGQTPWQRLHPGWWVESLFGGLGGAVEPAIAVAALLWCGLGLWQGRGTGVDRPLALPALILTGTAFLLPAVFHHTILFAARWLAPAAAFAVLAAPSPRLDRRIRLAVPISLLTALAVSVATGWRAYQDEEMSGFREALRALEDSGASPDHSLLGLDFLRTSPRLDGFPHHHLPAYAQVATGLRLNRSFADDPASLAIFPRLPHAYPWTDRLDWKPENLRRSDLDHFDFLLALAGDEVHARFRRDPRLIPLTHEGAWRLYGIKPQGDRVPP